MLQSLFGFRTVSSVPQVDAFELYEQISEDKNLLLVDVRSPQEYQYDGHIEGSRLLPLQVLMQRVEELPRDQPIIFVCRSGNRSLVACEQLSQLGFTNVKNFRGGMISWKRAGLPTR
jgi:rhodanese-related sulfurtransferase